MTMTAAANRGEARIATVGLMAATAAANRGSAGWRPPVESLLASEVVSTTGDANQI